MRVPPDVLKSVVFLGYRSNPSTDEYKWGGTAFLMDYQIKYLELWTQYVVTAKHCIEDIAKLSCDGKVYLRLNTPDQGWIAVSTTVDQWITHPDNEFVDVAVAPIILSGEPTIEYKTIGHESFCVDDTIEREQIGPGDEVFIAGLFKESAGRKRSVPIVRVGNVASLNEEPLFLKGLGETDAILIECRSFGGLSGSPVFVTLDPFRNIPPGSILTAGRHGRSDGEWRLLGLVHGHWDSGAVVDFGDDNRSGVNMGIAIVIPAKSISEVLEHPVFAEQRQALRDQYASTLNTPEPDSSEP